MSPRTAFAVAATLILACNSPAPQQAPSSAASSTMPSPGPTRIDPTPPRPGPLEQSLIDSGLVDIQRIAPGILVDLKYSTPDNFLKQDVYGGLSRCYLHPVAAEKLKKAQELLETEMPGHHLLVWDGVRPHHIQAKMWELLDIPFKRNYLAPPWEGSVHNYGCAVDLSIASPDGQPLDMGTPFDHFGKEAQPQLEATLLAQGILTEAQVQNRQILRRIMKEAGFHPIHTEWWHFNAVSNATVRKNYTRIP